MSPEINNPKENLINLINLINKPEYFGNDLELVRAAAEHHGIKMNAGSLKTPLIDNQYNLRLPDENDIESLLKADSISIICMDRRQSAQVAKELNSKLVMAQAGGPVQPDDNRMNLLVDFLVAAKAINKKIKIKLAYHLGVCGGANHFTDKQMEKYFKEGTENENMMIYIDKLVDALVEKGIDKNDISVFRVDVEGEEFKGITQHNT